MRRTPIHLAAGATAALLSLALPAFASGPATGGTPIATTSALEFSPNVASDDNGGWIVSWVVYTTGQLYALGLDANGAPRAGWPAGGLPAGNGTDPHMVADGAGGAFLTARSASSLAFQHVMPPGPAPARIAPTPPDPPAPSSQSNPREVLHNGHELPRVIPDGVGGAFVSYMDNQRFYDAGYVRRYAPDGTFIEASLYDLTGCGTLLCSLDNPVMCADGAGGAFVAWGQNCGTRVLRLTTALTPAPGWPAAGVVAEPGRLCYSYVGICPDGVGGAYVASQGYPNGLHDMRLQHVTANGFLASGWPDTGLVISPFPTAPGEARPYFGAFCSIVGDGSGGAIVAWSDQRDDGGDVYVQRILADGLVAPGWAPAGVPVGLGAGVQDSPVLVSDGAGGAIVAWVDASESPDFAIAVNRVSAAGAIASPGTTQGIRLAQGAGSRILPRIAGDGAGGAYVTWVDYRSGSADIYGARVAGDSPTATLAALVSAVVDEKSVRLEWSVSAEITGGCVVERRTESGGFEALATIAAAAGRVGYVDNAVQPGHRYAYRLSCPLAGSREYTDESWFTIPSADFALEAIEPNPTEGTATIRLALPGRGEARLELVDAMGRIRLRREVGSLGAGEHRVAIEPTPGMTPGIYFMRLTRGTQSRVARFVLLK